MSLLDKILKPIQYRWQYWRSRVERRNKAFRLARTIQNELARLGFVHESRATRRKRRKIRKVEFASPALLTPDELWLPLDLAKLPRGKTTNDLRDGDVIQSISDRIHASVRIDTLPTGRTCIVVRMNDQKFPKVVSINNFIDVPEGMGVLGFPLGVDIDGEPVWADLVELKHLLVAGATGGGKTNFLHTMIYTFINRNTPEQMELWMIDLKGQEGGKYRRLLSQSPGDSTVRFIADDPDSSLAVLNQAVEEIKRRNRIMQEHDASNLDDLARLSNIRLPEVVVVCDEIAVLTLNKERVGHSSIGAYAQNLITNIASLGRASGVHIVIATQHVKTEVLTGLIQANFENRVVFSTADWRKSQLLADTSAAVALPVGRCVFRHAGKTLELQTPYISPDQIRIEVGRIAQHGPKFRLGDADLLRHIRNARIILDVACEQFGGAVSRNRLRPHPTIRAAMGAGEFEQVCIRLERDGILMPPRNRTEPRRVAPTFFNKPHMLDAYYGIASKTDTDHPPARSPEQTDQVVVELERGEWQVVPDRTVEIEMTRIGDPAAAVRAASQLATRGLVVLGVGRGNMLTGTATVPVSITAILQAAQQLGGRFVVVHFDHPSALASELAEAGARVGLSMLDYVAVTDGAWHSHRANKSGEFKVASHPLATPLATPCHLAHDSRGGK